MRRKAHPKAITLILALLIMSAVVAIGITVSTIVVQQVRLNAVATEAHQGYYATESGLELGLFRVNTLKTENLTDALNILTTTDLDTGTFLPTGADESLFPAGYDSTPLLAQSVASTSAQTATKELQEGQSVMVELYDVDRTLTSLGGVPVMCVYGEADDTTPTTKILEISWVSWTSNLTTSRVQRVLVGQTAFGDTSGCSGAPGFFVHFDQYYPAAPTGDIAGYRVRVSLLRTDPGDGLVRNFSVTTTTSNPTPSQIQLKSVASLRNNTQALVALFPWSLPLSSLFDFVIYSEQPLTKDQPITIAEDVKTYGPFTTLGPGEVAAAQPDISPPQEDPFDSTVCSECSYYVRLMGSAIPSTTLTIEDDGDIVGAQMTIGTTATSCVLPLPFGNFIDPINATITFTDTTGLTGYQLLTQPTFLGPQETFCPTS